MTRARLEHLDLPRFGMPDEMPAIPPQVYATRLERLREQMERRGFDALIVYADREHSANMSYLTGFDPRFEEALLVVGLERDAAILVGNENWGTAGAAAVTLRRHLHQDFSLPSQPRNRSRSLEVILLDEGIRRGSRVGVVGWKTYSDAWMSDLPAYLIDRIRGLVDPTGVVDNATDLMIEPARGLRIINEVEQLAFMEWAASHTSDGVRRLIFDLPVGSSEQDAVALLRWNGTPLSCHLMLTAGPRATLGLLSPGDRRIEKGDRFTTAYGIWGALNCRAGFVVEKKRQLPDAIADYVDKLVAPYFEAIVEWYEALHIGQTGGALSEIIERRLGDPFFGIFLNPGHQIHLDEWVNSPVWPGSPVQIRSGMAMQVDVIPATGTDYFTTNIEDGIAFADANLRAEFATAYPGAWKRISARRAFMRDALGINLHEDVLPFSNIPAYLPPYLLAPDKAMSVA
jgi:hypothetical protein